MGMGMDMHKGGIPWLDQPVMLHSSRADKCKLTPAQCAYRNNHWRYWYAFRGLCGCLRANLVVLRYQADNVYALNTVYFLCAVIGVFTLSNLLVRLSPDWVKRTRIWRATTSISRYLAYRGYRFPVVRYWSPSLGVILLGLAGAVFFFGMADLQMGADQS